MELEFICVSGYGKSGSGACVDLLKEFKHIDGIENEFRLAKDPYGLSDLEDSIILNWEFVRHNTAINDFLSYCEMLSRGEHFFGKTGKDFSNKLNVDFLGESEKYINNITNFKYYGNTLLHRYNLSEFSAFIVRIRNKLGYSNRKLMYFSKPESDFFLSETRKYIKNLYHNYALIKGLEKIVLDQAIPPGNIDKTIRYFNSNKLIVIDRDPRDIYATMVTEKSLLGADEANDVLVEKYIHWHKSIRSVTDYKKIESNVLELKFESFFVDYENTINIVKNFLEIDYSHIGRKNRFNPDKISEHVGIWRQLDDQSSINRIYKELPDNCFLD